MYSETFVSTTSLKEKRENKKKLQKQALDQAKQEYEKAVRKEERKKQSGEADWMLPSLAQTLKEDAQIQKKVKKAKKKKKKEKKKKKKKVVSSSSSSSEDEWMEVSKKPDAAGNDEQPSSERPVTQRDSWMTDLTPTDTPTDTPQRDRLSELFSGGLSRRQERQQKKEEERKQQEMLQIPGQHERELNPYWKDGGKGLPEEKPVSQNSRSRSQTGRGVGDGGAGWLKRAYTRCEQQAKEQGRSLEEVAAERWGSLERLEKMIRDAEKGEGRRPGSERGERRAADRHADRRGSDGRPARHMTRPGSPRRDRGRMMRPGSPDTRDRRAAAREDRGDRRFRKPGSRSPARRGWRKPGHSPPRPDDRLTSSGEVRSRERRSRSRSRSPLRRPSSDNRASNQRRRKRSRSSSSSSSGLSRESNRRNSSDSSSSSSESEQEQAPVLTESELNQLGAKIVKAEILGDEELAAKLKAQLDSARRLRQEQMSKAPVKSKKKDEEVVLTRTDRDGNVRPLELSEAWRGTSQRKDKKVLTHESGERKKYFADDDKYNLKDLVAREKTRTAEDENEMFARLAGKSVERTDDDYQIDDVFVSRANKEQSDTRREKQDRLSAILEHKKRSKALESCQRCFENVKKHLIISIGKKVYLCLPSHKSMVDGHCLIVPIQHVQSGTACDEDVWNEVQSYRQALVRMFEEEDEDCVFMEMSRGLRHFPHAHIECIPLPRETGDMAPVYFKKALQEADVEWAQNKRVIDLSGKGVRKAVPKGFPYFSVDFGLQDGFAHVIEDESLVSHWFGREIVGGMLDLDPTFWRKPRYEDFESQRQKVLAFAERWKKHDPQLT